MEESLVVVATTATLVPPQGDWNSEDASPKVDFKALLMPDELYRLSVAKEKSKFKNCGALEYHLFLKTILDKCKNCLIHSSTGHLLTKSPSRINAPEKNQHP